jgi:hypothetical protein
MDKPISSLELWVTRALVRREARRLQLIAARAALTRRTALPS